MCLAERLNQIVLEVPEQDPDEIYREIRKEMNRGNPRPGWSQHDESGGNEPGGDEQEGAERERPGSETGDGEEAGTAVGEPAAGGARSTPPSAGLRGMIRPLGEAISAMREKIQWEWVDHSRLDQEARARIPGRRQGAGARASDPDHRGPARDLAPLDSGASQLAALEPGGL